MGILIRVSRMSYCTPRLDFASGGCQPTISCVKIARNRNRGLTSNATNLRPKQSYFAVTLFTSPLEHSYGHNFLMPQLGSISDYC